MKPLITKEEIGTLAGNYFGRLEKNIREGFTDYLKILSDMGDRGLKTNFKARTAACLIHDCIQTRLREAFFFEQNIKVGEYNSIFGIIISGKIFIRFKKLDHHLKASNARTEQSELFHKQQLEIPGFGPLTM